MIGKIYLVNPENPVILSRLAARGLRSHGPEVFPHGHTPRILYL